MKKIKLENPKNCQLLSINSLPNDVLLEIFQYFDVKSLKSALNVCQHWSQIIKSSSSLIKNLAIKVEASTVHIPIDGLMYRKLHFVGPVLIDIENCEFSDQLQNIQHLILEDFIFNENWLQKFKNVLKLEIFSKFDMIRKSGSTNFNENDWKNIFEFVLSKKKSLKELSIFGPIIEPQFIQKLLIFDNLTKIELKIEIVEKNQVIFCDKKWRKIKFTNPKESHKTFILNAAESCKNIKTLSIAFTDSGTSLPSSTSFFEEIPNFKSAIFSFEDFEGLMDLFSHLQDLSIKRLDNESQLRKLQNFLIKCPNLKSLNLNLVSNRAKLDQNLTQFLNSSMSLEQLKIEAYSDKLDMSSGTFEALKSLNINLKKLTIEVASQQVQEMKLKARKLLNTKIQTVVMEKEIHRTCLESYERNRDENFGICILEK